MPRLVPITLALLAGISTVRADDFAIELSAHAAKERASAAFPLPDKEKPRTVLAAGVNTTITVKWRVRGMNKTVVKDALVHFFVVKEGKLDQQDVPKLTKDVIVESALTMDFKAQDKTEGETAFRIANPGFYLVRIEIKKTLAKDGHAPVAALDLHVR